MKPTRDQIPDIIKTVPAFTDANVAYFAFNVENAPGLPFITYVYGQETALKADGINYYTTTHIFVELYTRIKDIALEQALEAAFTAAGIDFTKQSEFLADDQDWCTVYEMDLQN